MKKRTNWDVVSRRQYHETSKGRDVYNDQQMEREGLPEKQTMTLRLVLAVIASVLAAALFYLIWGVFANTAGTMLNDSSEGAVTFQEAREEAYAFLAEDSCVNTERSLHEPSGGVLESVMVEVPDRFMGSSPEEEEVTWADVFHLFDEEEGSSGTSSGDPSSGTESAGSVQYAFCPSCGTELEGDVCSYCGWTVPENGNAAGNSGTEEVTESTAGEGDSFPDPETEETGLEEVEGSAEPTAEVSDAEASDSAKDNNGTSSSSADLTKIGSAIGFRLKPYSDEQVFFSIMVGICTFGVLYEVLKRNLRAQNMLATTTDINQYKNDQHIMLPEEIHRAFDWFPDAGAHCSVIVHSLVSHSMLTNKGIQPVDMVSRYHEDILDSDGEVLAYKGEPVLDENGDPVVEVKPMFDKKFGQALFDTVDVRNPNRIFYDPTKIPYNPEGKRGKGKYDTVADFINADWEFPDYEVQRPAGAYLVDTAPVNTLVYSFYTVKYNPATVYTALSA